MPRFIAFLRAINVGGRTVKMGRLREVFEAAGFANVETFIASGNVVFETRAKDAAALEKKIEDALREALGYEVATFVRTPDELAAVADHNPFPRAQLDGAAALNVAFLKEPPDAEARGRLMARKTDVDDFAVGGREVYWLCRTRQSDSKFSNAALERALAGPATMRGANTVAKMAARYAAPGGRVSEK